MSNNTAYQKDLDKTIKELKSRVLTFNYSTPDKKTPKQTSKASLWEKAKKVGKNLPDDTLSESVTKRP